MSNCNWETIDNFQSYSEYERFQNWIQSQLNENLIWDLPSIDVRGHQSVRTPCHMAIR